MNSGPNYCIKVGVPAPLAGTMGMNMADSLGEVGDGQTQELTSLISCYTSFLASPFNFL